MNSVKGDPSSGLRPALAVLFLLLACASVVTWPPGSTAVHSLVQRAEPTRHLSREDELLLEDLQQRSFRYFWDEADPQTGLVPDRARMDGSPLDENHRNVASIAATGFGLTALCIAAEHGWVDRTQARERARNTLRYFSTRAFQEHGWFYHWLDSKTGERRWKSEVSSIDTALLLAGVLTTRQYYRKDAEIFRLATKIYERVDFRWMLNGDPLLLAHGWRPETGFLKPRWDTYSEDTILYLLAIGSPTYPISPASWYALWRDRYRYEGHTYFTTIGVPLFMHQYAHAWIDYRNRRETRGDHIDYFENSIKATLAHRAFCINLSHEFPGFGPNVWGITASDSAKGYLAWGGPPRDPAIDGTVVPSAAAGSLMFTPEISVAALRTMHDKYGDRIYGKFGFVDAFNPNMSWVDSDVIGINAGIMLLSAENLRTENVWAWFMQNTEIPRAMQRISLLPYRKRPEMVGRYYRKAARDFDSWLFQLWAMRPIPTSLTGETRGIPRLRAKAREDQQPLPAELGDDIMAYVGCIAGAIPIEDYRQGLVEAGFSNVEVVDSGADLNAYAKIENQAGCCSPAMTETSAPLAIVSSASSRELPLGAAACCAPQPASAGADLHEALADLLRRYNVNDYAASVKVYAVK